VRHRNHRAAAHQVRERGLDLGLRAAVQRRGGLVQQQHRRVLQHGARNADALALAARQARPALADHVS
jgi:hypothetical protein